jgi:hypothetical protein
MASWLKNRLDARALERAAHVFRQRQWHDAPGKSPVVSSTIAHLTYRARTLRKGGA